MVDFAFFTDVDLEQFARNEQRKKIRFEAQAESCRQTIIKLQTELTARALKRKSIRPGDLVTVCLPKGETDLRFEGLERSRWTGHPWIRLRAFTKRGKPFKKADSYRLSLIPSMTRKDQSNG